jgi:hypothetical protein
MLRADGAPLPLLRRGDAPADAKALPCRAHRKGGATETPARGGDRLPDRAIAHVRFEELERNPLAQLERIYGSIQLGISNLHGPGSKPTWIPVRDYSKSSRTFSKESIAAVTERWQPFVTRLGYRPPALERCAA